MPSQTTNNTESETNPRSLEPLPSLPQSQNQIFLLQSQNEMYEARHNLELFLAGLNK